MQSAMLASADGASAEPMAMPHPGVRPLAVIATLAVGESVEQLSVSVPSKENPAITRYRAEKRCTCAS